jgi:hypothetical protein
MFTWITCGMMSFYLPDNTKRDDVPHSYNAKAQPAARVTPTLGQPIIERPRMEMVRPAVSPLQGPEISAVSERRPE